ncbi:hypothetical protein AMQ84_11935 [Paenibacillus riograndensis]|uniref:Uncharacterized protein n=1 Tax=Paenibacillus riograndensis TaxID=483937 RepID=A0A132U290_9BACL|nr:hypothetical protein AMQ84_11935 [Paenibacillus riograndensis]
MGNKLSVDFYRITDQTAGSRSSTAGIDAFLAMSVYMLAALIGTAFTDLCTQAENFCNKRALPGHGLNSKRADIRTFPVQSDAFTKRRKIILFQA